MSRGSRQPPQLLKTTLIRFEPPRGGHHPPWCSQIRESFAPSSCVFAKGLHKFATDSRWVGASSRKVAAGSRKFVTYTLKFRAEFARIR
eukprot:5652018-Prymnesium_polylepis.1